MPDQPDATTDPLSAYQERRTAFAADLAAAQRSANALSNARLAVALAALAGFFWFIFRDDLIPSVAILAVGAGLFAYLMTRHDKALAREKHSAQLLALNEAGVARMEGRWNRFADDGREYADEAHPFASDLDLFGPASLFQWLNAAQTRFGRERLARLLGNPPRSRDVIAADQAMVRELAPRLDWRQRFQAAGGTPPARKPKEDPEALIAWAEDASEFFSSPAFTSALRFLPLLSFAYAAYMFVQHGLSYLMLPPFLIQAALASANQKRNGKILSVISRQKENLEIYLDLLIQGEGGAFTGPGLKDLAAGLRNSGGTPASIAVRGLQRLAEHLETRLNPILHHTVNILFLWDIQWLWVFRAWRRRNGSGLRAWLDILAHLETLSSLAVPAFENPDWAFPRIAGAEEDGPLIEAAGMAHPLIPQSIRVGNDLRLASPGDILIITGSNMSGKSTLMRTVGANLVLAYAGAPVCAVAFRCGRVEVHTSMRLKDDLEKRISSFYAELLRIKGIVEAARAGRQMLFLVDEIFRGTNSKDRHAGAMAVLKQLRGLKAAGLVSTHDLELARLEGAGAMEGREGMQGVKGMEPGGFRNFHFQEQYAEGKISFDYRMRPGVSTTTNAMHLLRMVGLGG
jgi:hypothetical protein